MLAGLLLALGRDVHAEDEALQLKERRDTLFSSYVRFRKNLPDAEAQKVPNTAETPGGGGGGGCAGCSDCSFMLQPGCFMGDLPCCSI